MTVILGPILGFRGLADGECRTCALVVAEENVAPPELAWFLDKRPSERRRERFRADSPEVFQGF